MQQSRLLVARGNVGETADRQLVLQLDRLQRLRPTARCVPVKVLQMSPDVADWDNPSADNKTTPLFLATQASRLAEVLVGEEMLGLGIDGMVPCRSTAQDGVSNLGRVFRGVGVGWL